jgi:ammonia channel protein AmtB
MQNVDLFFLLLGAVLYWQCTLALHFLELAPVRHKNQVNALSKIRLTLQFQQLPTSLWVIGLHMDKIFHAGEP